MSWITATSDLRTLLSDGPTDKIRYRKSVFGQKNGANKRFKTFEPRRVTDLTTATQPFGVFINGSLVATASDDLIVGEFELVTAPVDGDFVEATYYYQWFIDSELAVFLKNAAQWLGKGADITTVPDGLQPAALHHAAQESYHKLALKWSEHMSEMYLLEDAPKDGSKDVLEGYRALAKDFTEKATALRNDFYERQGQSIQPIVTSIIGSVRDVKPQR